MSSDPSALRTGLESDTASVASSTGESALLTPEQWRARLTRFYTKYNPACLSTVDTILSKYRGQEGHLMRVLIKRWGPEPDSPPLPTTAAPAAASPQAESGGNDGGSASGSPRGASVAATTASSAGSPARPSTQPPPNPTPAPAAAPVVAAKQPATPTTAAVAASSPTNAGVGAAADSASAVGRSRSASGATATSALGGGGGGNDIPPPNDPRWAAIYEAWLKKYEPARVAELGALMQQHRGKEKEGLVILQKERRAREEQTTAAAAAATAQPAPTAPAATTSTSGGLPPTTPKTTAATAAAAAASASASASASSAASQADEMMYRRRVIRFYQVYAPDKLGDFEEKIFNNPLYSNREYLLKVLTSKYGPEPVSEPLPPADWVAPVRGVSYPAASTVVPWPVRFYYMYLRYSPAQLPELPRKIEANSGHEGRWMSVLVREWGPEPETPRSFYDESGDSSDSAEVQAFKQRLSAVFSQFCPEMLPVVRVMAKEPSVVARRDELVDAARDYFLAAPPPSNTGADEDSRALAQERLRQEELERQRLARAVPPPQSSAPSSSSTLNTSLYSNAQQYEREAAASASAIRYANSPDHRLAATADNSNNNNSGRLGSFREYFSQRDAPSPLNAGGKPKDLVQQAVELVHQNRLLLHLQEPTDQELLEHLSQARAPSAVAARRQQLYQEASSLLQQPPVENSRSGSGANGYANRTRSGTPTAAAQRSAQHAIEVSTLTSRNQQLEELVSQLTSALDQKTNELQQVVSKNAASSTSSISSTGTGPATTQTVERVRINHATQTVQLVDGGGGANGGSGHTLAEEEIASLRASLGVREHQNRMLRIQIQQVSQELGQKEQQLRNSLACVDSLTATVNLRLRENSALKLDRVPASDASRFLEVVDEITAAFQQHYRETKERDEAEMNDYYQLANQMIANRDESILELTKALEAMMDERRKLLTAGALSSAGAGGGGGIGVNSIVEAEGEVVGGSVSLGGGGDVSRPVSVLEKKISRLERELARANTQLQSQNEEHATLVHALAVYSAGGNTSTVQGLSQSRSSSFNFNSNNNPNRSASFAPSARSAADADPFAALQAARQRNASEVGSIGGITKDEHHAKVEQLEAARLEAESARAALTAELHRRSVALEDNEKRRVEAESTAAQLKTELAASEQELHYWRGEAEARKRDVNKLVEHVATLSDALRIQKEAIANGNYLLSGTMSNNGASSNGGSPAAFQQQQRMRAHAASLAMDESDSERKIVVGAAGDVVSSAAASQSRTTTNNNDGLPRSSAFTAVPASALAAGGAGARSTPPPDPSDSLQIPLGHTRSNMWSMMYGSDQERVQAAQSQPEYMLRDRYDGNGSSYVPPYPSKGYHIESSSGPVAISGASPVRNKLAGTPSSALPGSGGPVLNRLSTGAQRQRQVQIADPELGRLPVSFTAGARVYDPNVTAAASVALARANVAATTPSQFL